MGQCSCVKSKPCIKISIASTNVSQCTVQLCNSKLLHVNKAGVPILNHPSYNPLLIRRGQGKVHPKVDLLYNASK